MSDTPSPTVGFIGLGDQGLSLAEAIAQAGHTLRVWGRPGDALAGLDHVPHQPFNDIGQFAAGCQVVALCVPTDDDVAGLTADLAPLVPAGSIIVNHGTGTPSAATKQAQLCAEYQVEFLDAPVTGGHARTASRTLTALVGGPTDTVARCEPVFQSFCAHVIHLGPHGAGQLAKLVNNALMMMNRANVADLIELLCNAGIDPVPIFEAVKHGSGSSAALQMLPTRTASDYSAITEHLSKVERLDTDLFAATAVELGVKGDPVVHRARRGAHLMTDVLRALNPRR